MTQLQQKLALPAAIAEKLDIVRRRTLKVQVGTAIVAALGVLLAAMGVAMLIDWLATLYDSRWRAALTYAAWMGTGATLVALAAAAWRHTRRVESVAAKVDQEIPKLEERWTTVTSLATNGQGADIHPTMFEQVSKEAKSWTPRVEVDQVVPLDGLIRALLVLTAITTILGLAVLFNSHRTTVLLRRFWQPFTEISATELADFPGDLVVGRGESLQIEANVVGTSVTEASLLLAPQEGDLKTITLTPRGENKDHLTHRLRSIKKPLRYRLRAGDGQTAWFDIVVADRPQLANVRLELTPPAYARKNSKVLNKLPRRVTVLEGTQVAISLKPKQALESLQLKLGPDLTEHPGLTKQLTADKNGWYHWKTVLTKSITFQPLLTEEHGLGNLRPPTCEIKCRPDKKPVVKILTPHREMAVRPDDTIPVTFVATDDVGIQEAELVIYDENQKTGGKPRILDTIPVPLGKQQGAGKVKATVELDLSKYKTVDGAELSFAIRVREDRGQAEADKSATRGQKLKTEESAKAEASKEASNKSPVATASADGKEPIPEKRVASAARETSKETPTKTSKENDVHAGSKPASVAKAAPSEGAAKTQAAGSESAATKPATPKNLETKTSRANAAASMAASPKKDTPGKDIPKTETPEKGTPQKATSPAAADKPSSSQPTSSKKPPSGKSSQATSQTSAKDPSQESSPSPGNPMTQRSLDTTKTQSSDSKRMRLKIDEWAGSYDGQQREKLEIAIGPKLKKLDQALEKAELLSRATLEDADASKPWASKHDRDIQRADKQVEAAIKIVESLEKETYDTPYAFIGLQLVDISQAHIGPARRDFWKSLQTDGSARVDTVRDGWQHTTRARELLVLLTERFQRTKTEYRLADSVEKVKKMYQVFVENSMALLRPEGEGDRYRRKMAEFELDEEYLKRLEEVLKMRSEMRAELARILAEDPRLLRRYLDVQRNRSAILRNELDRLTEKQSELNRETRAWTTVEEADRPQLSAILLGRHLESSQDLSIAAAELHDRFETWSPLGKEVEDADFQATAKVLQEIATATRELSADGLHFVDESKRATLADDVPKTTDSETVEKISQSAQQLYEHFTRLEVLLRQIGSREDRVDIANFATNRLLETRRLVEQTSAWIRQLKQQQAGNYSRSAEVAQYRLAMQTDAMAGKLADLESTMAGLLQRDDGKLPQSIAEKARGLLAALDEQAAPNQLAAVYALRRNQMPRATSRQDSAEKALKLAGKLYDEMIEASIKELDKLPVEDPIASLLDDPTLDELLRQLEQEIPLNEALGIPRRPSNLQIMSDWLQPNGGNGGMGNTMLNQMRQQQQMRQRQLDRAYRRAVARALKEAQAEDLVKNMPKLARETADWNRLASQLDDDLRQGRDKAPPERYRRAIEQYFRQISETGKDSEQ